MIKNLFNFVALNFMYLLFNYLLCFILLDICDVVTHTDFQLQLHGPVPSEAKHFIKVIDFTNCSKLCCKSQTCDVALFVNQVSFCAILKY